MACFKRVDTLLIAIETRRRHIYTLWRLRVCALLIVIENMPKACPYAMAFIFNLHYLVMVRGIFLSWRLRSCKRLLPSHFKKSASLSERGKECSMLSSDAL